MYEIRILEPADSDLARFDKSVGQLIAKRIRWLAKNLDHIKPEPLTGDLAGLYKFRAGDYRIFYQILPDEQTIVIHEIGHRRDVYRKRR